MFRELLAHTAPEWVRRYGPRASDYPLPKSEAKRLAVSTDVGEDGVALLSALFSDAELSALWASPAVETLCTDTYLFVGAHSSLKGVGGKLFAEGRPIHSSLESYDEDKAAWLWALSEQLVSQT